MLIILDNENSFENCVIMIMLLNNNSDSLWGDHVLLMVGILYKSNY